MRPLRGSSLVFKVLILLACLALALPVAGSPPAKAADGMAGGRISGFGLDGNYHPWQPMVASLAVYEGTLYVGTNNQVPGDIWSWDGLEWGFYGTSYSMR